MLCVQIFCFGDFFCLNKCYRLKKDKIAELYGMVRLCLALEEIAKSFAKEPVPFAPPASTSDGACCVACSPAFGVPVFWILAILRDDAMQRAEALETELLSNPSCDLGTECPPASYLVSQPTLPQR